MALTIFGCAGGDIVLPDPSLVLVDRQDGGNLVVTPPREVWERSELTPSELTMWSFLVAATGRAMLETLPQLQTGCLNYWEAGNWALNEQAEPRGPKTPTKQRRVHLHLLGRSPEAKDRSWQWGEAPMFPAFIDRHSWASGRQRLNVLECTRIVERAEVLLQSVYGMAAEQILPWAACQRCGYPFQSESANGLCVECQTQ